MPNIVVYPAEYSQNPDSYGCTKAEIVDYWENHEYLG